jgi:CubicO group peptidase (beta-lactamase class C family)
MLGYPAAPSKYKSFQMFLSGRDLARLGLLMNNGGVWDGRQLIPAAWIKESTALSVKSAVISNLPAIGYGYMWWKPSVIRGSPEWVNSFLAVGNWGQCILGLPAIDTVIVHRRAVTDEFAIANNMGKADVQPAGGRFTFVDFLDIADMILRART